MILNLRKRMLCGVFLYVQYDTSSIIMFDNL